MGLQIPLWKEFNAITQHNFKCALNELFWKPLCQFFYLHIHRNSLKLHRDVKHKQIHKHFIAHRTYVEQSTVCDLIDWERHNRLFDKTGIIPGSNRMM